MKEVRYFYVPDAAQQRELPADECQHAIRVLRLKVGDELFLMDGVGHYYRAQVTEASSHHCYYEIVETLPQERQWSGCVHLAIAPTKMMDRMEWMAEKITEIGIDELSFLDCQFSERRVVKLPRMEKIVVSAVKQSHKAWMPVLNEMTAFSAFIRQPRSGRKYIAHCYEEIPRTYLFDELRKPSEDADATVLVGPEGDFSIDEVRQAIAAGYTSVHLGQSRLRTETAGLSAVMMIQLSKEVISEM
jgi:16S rRNA (uracil1498-N3)-methyltransferase